MQTAFMLQTRLLNSPALFFAVVNILRIWGDFKCLCLSGLFLQKQLRTVFWQQKAYKNLEKKNEILKHLKLNSCKMNAPLLPYLKSVQRSRAAWRKKAHLPPCWTPHTSPHGADAALPEEEGVGRGCPSTATGSRPNWVKPQQVSRCTFLFCRISTSRKTWVTLKALADNCF